MSTKNEKFAESSQVLKKLFSLVVKRHVAAFATCVVLFRDTGHIHLTVLKRSSSISRMVSRTNNWLHVLPIVTGALLLNFMLQEAGVLEPSTTEDTKDLPGEPQSAMQSLVKLMSPACYLCNDKSSNTKKLHNMSAWQVLWESMLLMMCDSTYNMRCRRKLKYRILDLFRIDDTDDICIIPEKLIEPSTDGYFSVLRFKVSHWVEHYIIEKKERRSWTKEKEKKLM